jgi:hypothetical protein
VTQATDSREKRDDDRFVTSKDSNPAFADDTGRFDAMDDASVGAQRGSEMTPENAARDEQPNIDGRHERISARAYELYQQRGDRDNGELEDWLEAEREMAAENGDDR